jgi:hypothetical protein
LVDLTLIHYRVFAGGKHLIPHDEVKRDVGPDAVILRLNGGSREKQSQAEKSRV